MRRCTVCYRQGRGFGAFDSRYCFTNPEYIKKAKAFCSMRCMHIFGNHLKTKDGNMIDLTPFEEQAMKATLQPLGDYVAEVGNGKTVSQLHS